MTFKVKILPRAQLDAQCILDYLADRSPKGAADWWDAFESADELRILRVRGPGQPALKTDEIEP